MDNKKENPMDPRPVGLIYAKLAEIMNAVPAIGKDSKNQAQGFKFRSIDAIYNVLQPVFAAHSVFSAPTVVSEQYERVETKNGGYMNFCRLRIRYDFYTVDGSSVDVTVVGEAMDAGDKAANKAMAVAHKYAITQLVMLPFVSEDPDEHSHEVTKPKQNALAPMFENRMPPPPHLGEPPPEAFDEGPEDHQIPFGANMGKRLKTFSRDELLEMKRKSGEYLKKTPKPAQMYVETDKALEAVLTTRLPF